MRPSSRIAISCLAIGLSVACGGGGGEKKAADTAAALAAEPTAGAPITPDAGGQVIKIEMNTDDKGINAFTPNNIAAKIGDVLRFTLVSGVHNVNFLADSNRTATMPPVAPLLQAPGQTYDIKVSWPPGRYYFQCDPHALLGMVGHVNVK